MGVNLDLTYISIFFILAIFLPISALTMAKFLRPSVPNVEKTITYESGADPIGTSWIQYNVRYYLFALMFVIFDVETVFLYPWAVAYNSLRSEVGLFVLFEMIVFVFFLVLGLIYAWKKKVLEWK